MSSLNMEVDLEEEEGVHTALIDSLLHLVSRAHALCAELHRLSHRVSPLLFNERFYQKYKEVLFDFDYLKAPEHYEDKIERSMELLELSDSLKVDHLDVLKRYFNLFEHVVVYHQDTLQIMQDLERGAYIQSTLEGLLHDKEGKQLILEAISMLGVLLLLLDKEIPPKQRQLVIVSMYRYIGTADIPNFEEICKLCAHTTYNWNREAATTSSNVVSGFLSPSSHSGKGATNNLHKFPKDYPASYFARLPIPGTFVSKIVTRLLSEDFYNQLVYFAQDASHRSRALVQQASQLYVLLYFQVDILETEFSTMRELSDKHFVDNWVVVVYPGLALDVCTSWDHYKAAKAAIASIVSSSALKELGMKHVRDLSKSSELVKDILHDGIFSPDYLEQNAKKIMKVIQTCNVSLRWLVLNLFTEHMHSKKLREMFEKRVSGGLDMCIEHMLNMLLKLVEMEQEVMKHLRELVATKEERWKACQDSIIDHIVDLGEFYSGSKVLSREVKDEGLTKYFGSLAKHVKKLNRHKPTATGRKIQQLIQALEDVEDFHQLSVSLQTKEYLNHIRKALVQLTHIANISDHDIQTLLVSSDMGYAWKLMEKFTPKLHKRISREPSLTLRLRWLFLKMKSVLDVPLLRVNEANSPDLQSISEFWSSELVRYVHRVIEIIPITMFVKLDEIFMLQTNKLQELPTKLERTKLRNYVFASDRQELAKVTYSVAMLTEGIMRIETTQLGVEVIEPQVLLERGVRKQLIKRMTKVLQRTLDFETKNKSSSGLFSTMSLDSKQQRSKTFQDQLVQTSKQLQGIKRSLEYIQDYMQVYGLAIWQEEMCKLVKHMLDRELRLGLAHKAEKNKRETYEKRVQNGGDDDNAYLLEAIEVELYRPGEVQTQTFLGQLFQELICLTSPYETIYSFSLCGWFNAGSGKGEIGLNSFELIRNAIAVVGTHALDQIIQVEIFNSIDETSKYLNKILQNVLRDEMCQLGEMIASKNKKWLDELERTVTQHAKSHVLKPIYRTKLPIIGQGQCLRRHIAIELSSNAKLESATYIRSLLCLNRSLIRHEKQASEKEQSANAQQQEGEGAATKIESRLLERTARNLEYSGLQNPFHKVYHTFTDVSRDGDIVAVTLLVLAILFIRDYTYQRQNNSVPVVPVKKNKHTPDFVITTVGFVTVLQQLTVPLRLEFLELIQSVYKQKLKACCGKEELSISSKSGNELLVMNCFYRQIVQLLDIEGYALPKLFDDASQDIDISLLA